MGHVNAARAVIHGWLGAEMTFYRHRLRGRPADRFSLRALPASKHAAVALAEWLSIRMPMMVSRLVRLPGAACRTGMTEAQQSKRESRSGFSRAEDVARKLSGAHTRRFLVLPHPRVAEYEQRRGRTGKTGWAGCVRPGAG